VTNRATAHGLDRSLHVDDRELMSLLDELSQHATHGGMSATQSARAGMVNLDADQYVTAAAVNPYWAVMRSIGWVNATVVAPASSLRCSMIERGSDWSSASCGAAPPGLWRGSGWGRHRSRAPEIPTGNQTRQRC
jgi:hypothetical protein